MNASLYPSVRGTAYTNGYLCGCRLWTFAVYLNGIYSVNHLKFYLMWLKSSLMWLVSNHTSMLYTDGSHMTIHSIQCVSIRPFITLSPLMRSSHYLLLSTVRNLTKLTMTAPHRKGVQEQHYFSVRPSVRPASVGIRPSVRIFS